MYRLLSNKETDALFSLQEKRDENDDVDTLLRTTKRFIGKSKVIGPEHISIQRLSLIRLSDDSGSRSAAAKSNRKVIILYVLFYFSNRLIVLLVSWFIRRSIFGLFAFIVLNQPFWR